MAAKARTVEYYQTFFMGTGKEFNMKKLYKAAKDADDLHDFPKRSDAAYQVWASSFLRRLESASLVSIVRTPGGAYDKITVHNVEAACILLGSANSKKTKTEPETPKAKVAEVPSESTPTPVKKDPKVALTKEDQLCIVAKALRQAVHTGKIGHETEVDLDALRLGCEHKPHFLEAEEIVQCFSECGLGIPIPTINKKKNTMTFIGYCTAFKEVCEKGRTSYPKWVKLWNFEEGCGSKDDYKSVLSTIKEESSPATKIKPVVSTSEVVTDDDKFRIFVIGGYLMDRMMATHENASFKQLATVLEKKGKGLSTLRLESLVSSTPEFYVDDDEVYIKLDKEDEKTWWDKFRKKYRPLSGEKEQIICNLRMSLEEISRKLEGCCVELVDEHPDGFKTYRVDLPKNSIVARFNFADFMKEFREGEKIYTRSKLIDSLVTMQKKREAAWKVQDDLYRWEIGAFKKGL